MLTVYRASAGSGKTHLLTGFYINLLFSNETGFSNILAVTFTNKATEEMKERIVKDLFTLSSMPENSDYFEKISADYNLSAEEIKQKATKFLIEILHNYSYFNVSTIDHFFQQTTRAFTREIGLQGGYNVELDQNKVLEEAIDALFSNLDKKEYSQLLEWLIDFSIDKIESGKNWDIKRELISLSKEIFKEDYKKYSDEIMKFSMDKDNFRNFISSLKEIKSNFESTLIEFGKAGCNIMSQHDLKPDNFKGGSKSALFVFEKWRDGVFKEPSNTFKSFYDELSKWYTGKTPKDVVARIEEAYTNGLNACIGSAIELFETTYLYNSACVTLQHLFTIGILCDIDKEIRNYCLEKNCMLISDTNELLNKIIDGKDNPFIYEKIGTQIKNFMIDEFQDTSGMQWNNFTPLISESLSMQFNNLIVGDVKQSIYRWRNSDWSLLHSQIKSFNSDQRVDNILDTNWRSADSIVKFNNSFFTVASFLLQEKYNSETELTDNTIIEAYNDINQFVSPSNISNEGHVIIDFIDYEKKEDYIESALEKLPPIIETMIENGATMKDIAILVRTGKEGTLIANYLLKYKEENPDSICRFDIISNDSLYISQSKIIETIISFMRFILNDEVECNEFIASYNILTKFRNQNENDALEYYFSNKEINSELKEWINNKKETLRKKHLFEMTEEIINILKSEDSKKDIAFIQAFQDIIQEFSSSETADLATFLEWWDEIGKTKTITSPDNQDAIRIITIHKSKGLGFNNVIIPFASWAIDHEPTKNNLIWCKPSVEPFNRIPVIALKYSKTLNNSIYENEYRREKLNAFIDNLNVAYVAFTRAKNELIILCPNPKKSESNSDINSLLKSVSEWAANIKTNDNIDLKEYFDNEENVLELGNWKEYNTKKEVVKANIFNEYYSSSPDNRLQLKLYGKGRFIENSNQIIGNLMHDILSQVAYPDEVEDAVHAIAREGKIMNSEIDSYITKIDELISQDYVKEWFDKDNKVMNEKEILLKDETVLRPDRIIISKDKTIIVDYKFGSKERESYNNQVRNYMNQLWVMGYKNIEGYIWYVTLNKKVKIELQQGTLF